jgi:hypothetical protein
MSNYGPLEEEGNHPQEHPCQNGLGVKANGTSNLRFVADAFELPGLLEACRQPG